MGVSVLVVDWLLVGGALVVDVLIEHGVLADALHIGENVEAIVVSLQALELGELAEEVYTYCIS